MSQIDTTKYYDFITSKFSLNQINEAQASYLLSLNDSNEMKNGLQEAGIWAEFNSNDQNMLKAQQEAELQIGLIKDKISDLEKDIYKLHQNKEAYMKTIEPYTTELMNVENRLKLFPDNPRFINRKEELDKLINMDKVKEFDEKINKKEIELTNLKLMESFT